MVLVPLDGALDAVQVRLTPLRIVAGVLHPALRLEPVRLQVALQHHPETELIGQVEQARMRRVMAGADRIHVEPLHELQVGPGRGLIKDAAPIGVRLMPVHAVKDHPAPVHQKLVAHDLHGAKTQPQRHRLPVRRHLRVIEPRQLGRPRVDGRNRHRRHVGGARPGDADAQLGHRQGDRKSGCVGRDLRRDQPRPGALTARAGAGAGEVGAQPDVVEAARRPRLQGDITKNARQPPLVLVFQIAGR